MAGVVIGSVITKYHDEATRPRAVAVTVNNQCNLACPHCYLQYSGPRHYLTDYCQKKLLDAQFEHLAIVGMEPLVTRRHAKNTVSLAKNARKAGKTVSLITNGYGLMFLEESDFSWFDFIDISLDGGPQTYQTFRGGSYAKLTRTLASLPRRSIRYNALHTLCEENLANIDDMIHASSNDIFQNVHFSPYVESKNEGTNTATGVPLSMLLQTLARQSSFLSDTRTLLLLDAYHLYYEGLSKELVQRLITDLNLTSKVYLAPHTPLNLGILRITYEGQILPPETAIHPARYGEWHYTIDKTSLFEAYQSFLKTEKRFELAFDTQMVA